MLGCKRGAWDMGEETWGCSFTEASYDEEEAEMSGQRSSPFSFPASSLLLWFVHWNELVPPQPGLQYN